MHDIGRAKIRPGQVLDHFRDRGVRETKIVRARGRVGMVSSPDQIRLLHNMSPCACCCSCNDGFPGLVLCVDLELKPEYISVRKKVQKSQVQSHTGLNFLAAIGFTLGASPSSMTLQV